MKIYILVRNDYCIDEYDDEVIIDIYTDFDKATKRCTGLNSEHWNRGAYNYTKYRVDTYSVVV